MSTHENDASSGPQPTPNDTNEQAQTAEIAGIAEINEQKRNTTLKVENSLLSPGRQEPVHTPESSPVNSSVTPDMPTQIEPDSDEDEYITSGDDDAFEALETSPNAFRHLTLGSGIAEHTAFFEKSLNDALDSVALDSSLALQAQVSGQINDKTEALYEKQKEIEQHLLRLKSLHKQYISDNKLGVLEKDIDNIATRIQQLKHGRAKSSLFGKKMHGVVDKYPVEYNQAKDKVLERETS